MTQRPAGPGARPFVRRIVGDIMAPAMTQPICRTPLALLAALAVSVHAAALPAPSDALPAPQEVAGAVAAAQGPAVAPAPFAPGVVYDSAIPTLKQVTGHDVGEEITSPDLINVYLRALHAAAPQRTRLVEYARTWEGRPLMLLVMKAAQRLSTLDTAKAGLRKLADPRTLAGGEAEQLIRDLPSVAWLIHAVHGNEISSSDAALLEAYHLLAAKGDPTVDLIMRETIVLIDPLQNPDGRARFVATTTQGRAATPDAYRFSAEHDEPWPGGRANHYLFDMNRDWFSQSQPETRGRTKIFLEWYPHVTVDLHEMSGDATYYFAPPADPLNPHITRAQGDWFTEFGRQNARAFDARGFAYFNREVYDSFYPGYGESWPIFHGSIGMTYEQASARGLVFLRNDKALLHYRDTVMQHFTAAITTLETTARNRERLLRDFVEYRRSAIREGETGPVRQYLLPHGKDPSRTDRLARLLVAQGFEVKRADEPIGIGTRTLPAGTYVVPVAQPAGRLVRNLLEPHVAQPEAFVKEQERRRAKRLGDQIYDTTAWSLALAFDVEALASAATLTARTSAFTGELAARATTLPDATVGYLLPWGSATANVVIEALQAGLSVRTNDLGFTLGGRAYAPGTAIVRVTDNAANLASTLGAIVARHGAEAVAIDSAFTEAGSSLGSGTVVKLRSPRVLLAWDAPTSSLSAGWARYVIERRFNQPVSAVRVASFARVDFRDFDVVVLPSGNFAIAGETLRRLKDWVTAGGTLITLAEATRWVARESTGLLDTRMELRDGRPDVEASDKDEKKAEKSPIPFDYEKAIQPVGERPENTPGALLRVTIDGEHWLGAGLDGEIQVLQEGSRVLRPITLDKGTNVGVFQKRDRLVAGGLMWPDAQDLVAQKAFVVHQPMGQGHIVAFTEDPNYRAFMEATELLFINAIVLAPVH